MIHRHYTPRPPLSDFVELLWLFEEPVPSHASERVLPTGTTELVINLGDGDRGFDAVVAGPHSRYFTLDTTRPSAIVGAHFKPGGVFAFLGLPVDELHNRHVSLEALWGPLADEMRERLLATLALFFAGVALLLAGVGLYGVLDYSVIRRRREIAIRMAIGAEPASIARLVTTGVISMVFAGSLAGVGLGMTAARYIETLLYQVKATDWHMLAPPALTIAGAALLAGLPAVLRALRTEPNSVLRAE